MEIIVVDDVSTKDDPETVVNSFADERIKFVRNERNLGASQNFNRCIELAQGQLIHILHGDDEVEQGFYRAILELAIENPQCALIATRARIVEEDGTSISFTQRLPKLEAGGTNVSDFLYDNPLRTPSVVVRKSFYEAYGGVDISLKHVADWEMWARAVHLGGGIISKEALAVYRSFEGNDTGRLALTANNVRDCMKLIDVFRSYPEFQPNQFRLTCARFARSQAEFFRAKGNREGYSANMRLYRELRDYKSIVKDSLRWTAHLIARAK
jgi:glycosyltransferase involved in cell wall biosynthesis